MIRLYSDPLAGVPEQVDPVNLTMREVYAVRSIVVSRIWRQTVSTTPTLNSCDSTLG